MSLEKMDQLTTIPAIYFIYMEVYIKFLKPFLKTCHDFDAARCVPIDPFYSYNHNIQQKSFVYSIFFDR